MGHFPRPDAFDQENSETFDPNHNYTLDYIAHRLIPAAYPRHTVSSVANRTAGVGANPVYTVTITSEPHPVKMFCDSRDSMYVMVPLVDNPRVLAMATRSHTTHLLAAFLTYTEHFPYHAQVTHLSSGRPETNAPLFRVLFRSTGSGPGTKHLIFGAYRSAHIMTFLEVYLGFERQTFKRLEASMPKQ